MRATTATMRMRMRIRRKKHRKPMMDQRSMWRTHLGICDIDSYKCKDGDDADTDAVEEASQVDAGTTQNMEA
jgi:hypothetical protein